ncbi:hypothetical protein [Commensalibacter nepenthis]|uniref:Uncharacterized protein n=1 Tax=Commensalibacter nepenthis TaxID=3043872 RepID=A0ABT6Q861_9PROT|nr:hypothetical protein [Commensalibacter sp. TBRC 10068]MDI2113087.1 hypothetical protein [Commensalibacter sp. TBRC 10068]
METIKILIAVKTYPCRSDKYVETVCTAGFREDGSWIRLYPIPFRLHDNQYAKYQWIEAKIEKNTTDMRPESYRIVDIDNIKLLDKVDTKNNWQERRNFIFSNNKIYKNLTEVIDLARNNDLSLAIFKPTKIIDFVVENVELKERDENYKYVLAQSNLFEIEEYKKVWLMPLLSKKFFYIFEDEQGKKSKLLIEDWEICQLYLNCKRREPTEEMAIQKVKEKYWDNFAFKKDLHFFLGTTLQWHRRRAKNPFVITGVFYPPLPK